MEDLSKDFSRRNSIKGVIAAGAAVSSAAYVFRGSPLLGQQASAPGAVERLITLGFRPGPRRLTLAAEHAPGARREIPRPTRGHHPGQSPPA
jgi:hypothetical protein